VVSFRDALGASGLECALVSLGKKRFCRAESLPPMVGALKPWCGGFRLFEGVRARSPHGSEDFLGSSHHRSHIQVIVPTHRDRQQVLFSILPLVSVHSQESLASYIERGMAKITYLSKADVMLSWFLGHRSRTNLHIMCHLVRGYSSMISA
jgi:hypothetical protein